MKNNQLRNLPAVDEVLAFSGVEELITNYPRPVVVTAIRDTLEDLRKSILEAKNIQDENVDISPEAIALRVSHRCEEVLRPRLRRVINATGVVVHTNLGRSILAKSALQALMEVARGYSNLEYNLESGERGSRHDHIRDIIIRLTGAEDAMVVNNNAAAVLLALSAIAKDKEVVVSRGQLVEIGGSFRIPDVMRQSGASLVEVGATNKTHLEDYRKAISENTGMLLKVHSSNFKIVGFTSEVSISSLVSLGQEYGVPVMDDLGSGMLVDLAEYGSIDEPTVHESINAGAQIVTFSGDKLLGGPQAGIMVGARKYISMCRTHPLARAVRVDKFTLAALEATLRIYLDPQGCLQQIPTLNMITQDVDSLMPKAKRLAEQLTKVVGKRYYIEVVTETSKAGGGALPLLEIPTAAVAVMSEDSGINELESRLRAHTPPIIARIKEERLILDVRTIAEDEFGEIVSALNA